MNHERLTNNNNAGYTYIELILYIAIVSIMLNTLIPFAWNVIYGGVKSSVQQEVFSQARFVSEKIKYEIRNAKTIDIAQSTFDVHPGRITLINQANQTVVIDVAAGKARIKIDAAAPVALNSRNTSITNLTFRNYTSIDDKTKHIGFTLALQSEYALQRQEYQADISVESSAEVRSH